MNKTLSLMLLAGSMLFATTPADACTGITLKSKDGHTIPARTIEWGGSDLNSQYVIVPRGYTQQSYLPGGATDGMKFTARYGYVGLAVEQKEFVAEGLNEAGLSAGLFYFPNYGQYETYDDAHKASSIADLQLVSLLLGQCATVDEVKETVEKYMLSTSTRVRPPYTGASPTFRAVRLYSKSSEEHPVSTTIPWGYSPTHRVLSGNSPT